MSLLLLPPELHLQVLSELPLATLLQIRLVCSYFYTLCGYSMVYLSAFGSPPKDFLDTLRSQNISWEEAVLSRRRCKLISWSLSKIERILALMDVFNKPDTAIGPSEITEKINLLREEGMNVYESAASLASSASSSRKRQLEAHLLFAIFYHTNAMLYSIMSDAKGSPKQFSEQWLAIFNETCNSRPAAMLAHGQMIREQYQPAGEANTLEKALQADEAISRLYHRFHPEGLPEVSSGEVLSHFGVLPSLSTALRSRIIARALVSHKSLHNHVHSLRLVEFRAEAEGQTKEEEKGHEDPSFAKQRRIMDYRLIFKLMKRCRALCKKQTESPLNDRPLFDLMGTACMELAHVTARENAKALSEDPEARIWLEEAKNHFSLLERTDPFRCYNLACWHSLMQHSEETKKQLESLAPLLDSAESADIFFRSLTDPDLAYARQQAWWRKVRNQLLLKLSSI